MNSLTNSTVAVPGPLTGMPCHERLSPVFAPALLYGAVPQWSEIFNVMQKWQYRDDLKIESKIDQGRIPTIETPHEDFEIGDKLMVHPEKQTAS